MSYLKVNNYSIAYKASSILRFIGLPFAMSLGATMMANCAWSVTPVLPPGFIISKIADNLQAPTNLRMASDGRLFVSLKSGSIKIIKNNVVLNDPFLTVDTDTAGEHGLIGMAFDPNFNANGFVYVYYVAKTPTIHSRISRFTGSGDAVVPGSELILMDLDSRGTSIFHVAGAIEFGNDGKLYIASGDNAGWPYTDNSQRLTNTLGKILRINPDGTIPSDNPFVSSATGINQSIWALGFRNPYSLALQPNTGKMYANDVGQSSWEEINEIVSGGNYGWPTVEGIGTNPGFKNPVYAYGHGPLGDDVKGCAITGGAFYNPIVPQFPNLYVGKYFYLDYCNNWMHTFDPVTGTSSSFAQDVASSPVNLITGVDGSLYFMSEWENSVYKLSFPGNGAPQIVSLSPDVEVSLGSSAVFTVTASGTLPLTYQWQMNNVDIPGATGSTYTLQTTTMADNGKQFRCVITNGEGSITSSQINLKVVNGTAPTASIDYPEVGTRYNAGDKIYYGGTALDSNGEELGRSTYSWRVDFHHNNHVHPFIDPIKGKTGGFFVIPRQGETSDNTWYEIILTITNSAGLTAKVTREIYPNKSIFNLKTIPEGLQLTLDGQGIAAPVCITGVVGFERTLGVVSPQVLNGVSYEFSSWADGSAETHSFRTSVSQKTYTAVFRPVGAPNRGQISATPNPALVCDGSGAGSTTLSWTATGAQALEVHINAPNGNLLAASFGDGSITTPKWVGDGSTFYLQDVSNGLPLTEENTLAAVTVHLTDYGCFVLKRK